MRCLNRFRALPRSLSRQCETVSIYTAHRTDAGCFGPFRSAWWLVIRAMDDSSRDFVQYAAQLDSYWFDTTTAAPRARRYPTLLRVRATWRMAAVALSAVTVAVALLVTVFN